MSRKTKEYKWPYYSRVRIIVKRIRTYLLRASRSFRRNCKKQVIIEPNDDPEPARCINRRAKFVPFNSRGKFGFLVADNFLDKQSGSMGCRGPPINRF